MALSSYRQNISQRDKTDKAFQGKAVGLSFSEKQTHTDTDVSPAVQVYPGYLFIHLAS